MCRSPRGSNILVPLPVEVIEAGQPGLGRESDMGTSIANVIEAHCPLCGSPVLSVARSGKVFSVDLRAIPIGGEFGRGYTLCDNCGVLADLPTSLTLN